MCKAAAAAQGWAAKGWAAQPKGGTWAAGEPAGAARGFSISKEPSREHFLRRKTGWVKGTPEKKNTSEGRVAARYRKTDELASMAHLHMSGDAEGLEQDQRARI